MGERARAAAIALLALASPLTLICLLAGGAAAGWALAVLTTGFPVALALLGAAGTGGRSGSGGRSAARLGWSLAGVFALLAGSLGGMLALGGSGARLGGFPAGAAILVFGLGLVAFAATSAIYAATFGERGPRVEGLRRPRS